MAHGDEQEPPVPESGPVSLVEDGDTGARFLIYEGRDGVQVELRVEGDTFWATQQQMADAFGVTRQNITLHLQNVFREGELNENTVCKESLLTARDGREYWRAALMPENRAWGCEHGRGRSLFRTTPLLQKTI